MTNSSTSVDAERDPQLSSGVRFTAKEGVRKAAKAVFAAADLFLGAWPGPRILIYHQIGAGSGRQMDLAASVFRSHVDWLQTHGRIVGLENALADVEAADSHRSYVLSFDDGYADFYENAFPLLRERNIPFTVYLTTGHIETRKPLHPGDRPLTWDQVDDILESGLATLGAHTHTHPDLRGMSVDEVAEEVVESNLLIKRRTGQAPRHFAYPKGYWAQEAETVVRRNYDTAVLGAGSPVTKDTDPHRISRVPVQQSDGHFFFTRKMVGGMRMEERARTLVRGYRNPSA